MRFSHCMAAAFLAALPALAAEVNVIGLFPGKAVVVINGAPPRTLSVGQKTPEGVTLLDELDRVIVALSASKTEKAAEAAAVEGAATAAEPEVAKKGKPEDAEKAEKKK